MVLNEAHYFTRRALAQLEQAAAATDYDIECVHAKLSGLYLERARDIVASATSVGRSGNVVQLRAIA